ncbi:putative HEAT repeat-containing domain protein [Trichinella spiralis]|uniref:putative HEAT repeat-containing domain protein n=1 Tax=Trichinella spiralis TaxID=6334 RepID=UPI0001EFD094|nr:putative HEAT repeat-containing domain protein [Trichinella spiralis]
MTNNVQRQRLEFRVREIENELSEMLDKNALNKTKMRKLLEELRTYGGIDVDMLVSTNIGKTVNRIRTTFVKCPELFENATFLVKKWKKEVNALSTSSPFRLFLMIHSVVRFYYRIKCYLDLSSPVRHNSCRALFDSIRSNLNNCRAMFEDCDANLLNDNNIKTIVQQIEESIYELNGSDETNSKYCSEIRSHAMNLCNSKNCQLLRDILTGKILPANFAKMTTEEMAPEEVKNMRKAVERDSLKEHMLSNEGSLLHSTTFHCRQCGQRDCNYTVSYEKDGHEAEAVTYVVCNQCGHRKKEAVPLSKEKAALFYQVAEALSSNTLKQHAEYGKAFGNAFTILFSYCDDPCTDVRILTEETMNIIIRSCINEWNISRVHSELCKELKRNGSARCIRSAMGKFVEIVELIGIQKRRQFAITLIPLFEQIIKRPEEMIQDCIGSTIARLLQTLGRYFRDEEIHGLIHSALANLQLQSTLFRRVAATFITELCHNSRRRSDMISYWFRYILTKVTKQDCDDVFHLLGNLLTLKMFIPLVLKEQQIDQQYSTNVGGGQRVKQISSEIFVQLCEAILFYTAVPNDVVNSLALEMLVKIFENSTQTQCAIWLSKNSVKKSRFFFPSADCDLTSTADVEPVRSESISSASCSDDPTALQQDTAVEQPVLNISFQGDDCLEKRVQRFSASSDDQSQRSIESVDERLALMEMDEEAKSNQQQSNGRKFDEHSHSSSTCASVRGFVSQAVASLLISTATAVQSRKWNNDDDQEFKEEMKVLKRFLEILSNATRDESNVCIHYTLSSLRRTFSIMQKLNPSEVVNCAHSLLRLASNPYWLVKVKLAECFEELDFCLISLLEETCYSNLTEKLQPAVLHCLIDQLLLDEDRRVSSAASTSLLKLIPRLYFFGNVTLVSLNRQYYGRTFSGRQNWLHPDLPTVHNSALDYSSPSDLHYNALLIDDTEHNLSTVIDLLYSTFYKTSAQVFDWFGCIVALDELATAYPPRVYRRAWSTTTTVNGKCLACPLMQHCLQLLRTDCFQLDPLISWQRILHFVSTLFAACVVDFESQPTNKKKNIVELYGLTDVAADLIAFTMQVTSMYWHVVEQRTATPTSTARFVKSGSGSSTTLSSPATIDAETEKKFLGLLGSALQALSAVLEAVSVVDFSGYLEDFLFFSKSLMPLMPAQLISTLTQVQLLQIGLIITILIIIISILFRFGWLLSFSFFKVIKVLFGTNLHFEKQLRVKRTQDSIVNQATTLQSCSNYEHFLENIQTHIAQKTARSMMRHDFVEDSLICHVGWLENNYSQYGLRMYTVQSDGRFQAAFVGLICHLLLVKVNYSVLDPQRRILNLFCQQLEHYIEDDSNIAMHYVVLDLFLLRQQDVGNNELEIQQEVVIAMLTKALQYAESWDSFNVIMFQLKKFDERRWRKISRDLTDRLLPLLLEGKHSTLNKWKHLLAVTCLFRILFLHCPGDSLLDRANEVLPSLKANQQLAPWMNYHTDTKPEELIVRLILRLSEWYLVSFVDSAVGDVSPNSHQLELQMIVNFYETIFWINQSGMHPKLIAVFRFEEHFVRIIDQLEIASRTGEAVLLFQLCHISAILCNSEWHLNELISRIISLVGNFGHLQRSAEKSNEQKHYNNSNNNDGFVVSEMVVAQGGVWDFFRLCRRDGFRTATQPLTTFRNGELRSLMVKFVNDNLHPVFGFSRRLPPELSGRAAAGCSDTGHSFDKLDVLHLLKTDVSADVGAHTDRWSRFAKAVQCFPVEDVRSILCDQVGGDCAIFLFFFSHQPFIPFNCSISIVQNISGAALRACLKLARRRFALSCDGGDQNNCGAAPDREFSRNMPKLFTAGKEAVIFALQNLIRQFPADAVARFQFSQWEYELLLFIQFQFFSRHVKIVFLRVDLTLPIGYREKIVVEIILFVLFFLCIGVCRLPQVFSFCLTPFAAFPFGWVPDVKRIGDLCTFSNVPVRFLVHADVLKDFIYRVCLLGWLDDSSFLYHLHTVFFSFRLVDLEMQADLQLPCSFCDVEKLYESAKLLNRAQIINSNIASGGSIVTPNLRGETIVICHFVFNLILFHTIYMYFFCFISESFDLVSCMYFVIDLFDHWFKDGPDQVPLLLLISTLDAARSADDEFITNVILFGILKCAANLCSSNAESLKMILQVVDHGCKIPFQSNKMFMLFGLLQSLRSFPSADVACFLPNIGELILHTFQLMSDRQAVNNVQVCGLDYEVACCALACQMMEKLADEHGTVDYLKTLLKSNYCAESSWQDGRIRYGVVCVHGETIQRTFAERNSCQ